MRNKIKIALACALLFSSVTMAQDPADVTTKFNEAATLLGEGKIVEAIPVLETVIAKGLDAGPDVIELVQQAQKLLPQCYFTKGRTAASAGNFSQAEADLSKAADLGELYGVTNIMNNANAMLPKVYMADGAKPFNEKNYAKAIEIFSKAYAKFPNNTETSLLLAKSYAESGDLGKAADIYKKVLALEASHSKYAPAAATAKEELGTYMLIEASDAAKENDLATVVKVTDAVLEFDPTNAVANMLRLATANNLKDYDAVIGFGEAAVSTQVTDTDKSNANFILGAAYQNKDNKAKAIECFKKVTAGPNVATAKAQIAALSK